MISFVYISRITGIRPELFVQASNLFWKIDRQFLIGAIGVKAFQKKYKE